MGGYVMKRKIAALLLVVCIALPIIALAVTFHCTYCGGDNAVAGSRDYPVAYGNLSFHRIARDIFTNCPDCGHKIVKYTLNNVGIAKHTPVRKKMVISPSLVIDCEACSACGQIVATY